MYCNKCGEQLPDKSAFCSNCGKDLRGPKPNTGKMLSPPKVSSAELNKPVLLGNLICLLILTFSIFNFHVKVTGTKVENEILIVESNYEDKNVNDSLLGEHIQRQFYCKIKNNSSSNYKNVVIAGVTESGDDYTGYTFFTDTKLKPNQEVVAQVNIDYSLDSYTDCKIIEGERLSYLSIFMIVISTLGLILINTRRYILLAARKIING